jgi:amino acid transporter
MVREPFSSDEADARALSRLGYAQELLRAMGGFSSFALSFSIISVLTGVVTTYDVAISNGGPAALGLGWPLVSIGTLLVALSMSELASAIPTAGAMYHWAAVLGGPAWGWMTSMLNLVGQFAMVAAVDVGCAQQAVAAAKLGGHLVLPLFLAIVVTHGLLNFISVRLVAWLNDLSASVHILGVVGLVALLVAFGHARPLAFAFQAGFSTRADGNYALGFVSSLLLGMWTFTGFDASAHVSEETHDPARRAPWGIVSSVIVSAVAGYALVVTVTLCIRDLPKAAADPHPALLVLRNALGDLGGSLAMGLAITAMWFCGLSAVTSASRTLYAFARDGGVPLKDHLRAVSPRHKTPHFAILATCTVAIALGLSSALLSEDEFLAIASLATTALYLSYAIPIALGAVARHGKRWNKLGPWNLGRAGVIVAWAGVAWSVFVLIAVALPHPAFVGLLAAVIGVLAALYVTFVRGRFRGPEIGLPSVDGG